MNKAEQIPEFTTISEVSRATGMNPRTIRKRIENLQVQHILGTNNFYKTLEVFKNIYLKATDEEKSELNLSQEKAGYYYELKLKTRLEREKLSDKYVDVEEFNLNQMKRFIAFKEKLLAVAVKLGPKVSRKDPETATDLINESVKEALKELIEEELERVRLQHKSLEANETERNGTAEESSTTS